ncbi:DUF1189 family protein [Planococcus maritimus]|nr:DUF1189 family protein [Planococcus sp. SK3692]MDE4083707.1 DUF1189 family protein [Planococcus maritimus]
MNLYQLFKASFMEPKKRAAVRIMPIGRILKFVFLFIALLSLISFAEFALGIGSSSSELEGLLQFIEEIEWLLYPFALVFLFVSTTLYHFIKISVFAAFGYGFLALLKRRGEYRHMWRTAALAVTVPTIVAFVASFWTNNLWISLATSIWTLFLLYSAARFYPKAPPAKK